MKIPTIDVRDVLVFRGEPLDTYSSEGQVTGQERDEALLAFREKRESPYTFWHAPGRDVANKALALRILHYQVRWP